MQSTQAIFEWPITVYYEDTDAGGVVPRPSLRKVTSPTGSAELSNAGIVSVHVLVPYTLNYRAINKVRKVLRPS